MRFLLHLLVTAVAFWVATRLVNGLSYTGELPGLLLVALVFGVVNAVLIRSLPYSQPERIMQVAEKNDKLDLPTFGASALNFLSWREQTHTFEQLAGMGFGPVTVSAARSSDALSSRRVQLAYWARPWPNDQFSFATSTKLMTTSSARPCNCV